MYDPYDGLGPSFRGDATTQDRVDGEAADAESAAEHAQAKLADMVVLQAVKDMVDPEASDHDRMDAVRWVRFGDDLPWLRGGSAVNEEAVIRRHQTLFNLAQLALDARSSGARMPGIQKFLRELAVAA